MATNKFCRLRIAPQDSRRLNVRKLRGRGHWTCSRDQEKLAERAVVIVLCLFVCNLMMMKVSSGLEPYIAVYFWNQEWNYSLSHKWLQCRNSLGICDAAIFRLSINKGKMDCKNGFAHTKCSSERYIKWTYVFLFDWSWIVCRMHELVVDELCMRSNTDVSCK